MAHSQTLGSFSCKVSKPIVIKGGHSNQGAEIAWRSDTPSNSVASIQSPNLTAVHSARDRKDF